jgi:hypothetical protein
VIVRGPQPQAPTANWEADARVQRHCRGDSAEHQGHTCKKEIERRVNVSQLGHKIDTQSDRDRDRRYTRDRER